MNTTPGQSYCVNVLTAPVEVQAVYADGTLEPLKTLDTAGQYTFIAMSAETRFSGGEIGKQVLPVPFNSAPAGNGNGGGEQPASPEVFPLSYDSTLADGRVYHAAATGQGVLDLNALSVEPNATARIWLDYGGGPVNFPSSWVWSDSADFQLPAEGEEPQGVGDFTPGETYLITVCRYKYAAKDFVLAHRALTIKPATA